MEKGCVIFFTHLIVRNLVNHQGEVFLKKFNVKSLVYLLKKNLVIFIYDLTRLKYIYVTHFYY